MATYGPTTSRAGFRQILTPLGSASRKRKDRNAPPDASRPPPLAGATFRPPLPKPKPKPDGEGMMLVAGYLAHEFLTRGTLLGECLDPSTAARSEKEEDKEKAPFDPQKAVCDRQKAVGDGEKAVWDGEKAVGDGEKAVWDGEKAVGMLVLGEGGARVAGVVNPSQLVRWLRTK